MDINLSLKKIQHVDLVRQIPGLRQRLQLQLMVHVTEWIAYTGKYEQV